MSGYYKAIIYDWDGCLLQSLSVWVDAYKEVMQRAGIKVAQKDIMKHLGNWDAAKILGHPDLKQANQELLAYADENIPNTQLYPHVVEALSGLRDEFGISIFIVTATRRQTALASKGYQEIKELVKDTICADDVTKHKPDPEAINLIIDRYGYKREDVLMVGDSTKDLLAAKAAGIDGALYSPDINKQFHDKKHLMKATPRLLLHDHRDVLTSCRQTLQAVEYLEQIYMSPA